MYGHYLTYLNYINTSKETHISGKRPVKETYFVYETCCLCVPYVNHITAFEKKCIFEKRRVLDNFFHKVRYLNHVNFFKKDIFIRKETIKRNVYSLCDTRELRHNVERDM